MTDNGSNMVKAFKESLVYGDEEEELQAAGSESDHDLDIDDEPTAELAIIDDDLEADFEEREADFDLHCNYQRLSCFAHSLQLVACQYDRVKSFTRAVNKAKKLCSKFNKSVLATEQLVKLSGIKLIGDCPTRWSSTYIMISRLLDLRSHVSTIIAELEWDDLRVSEYKLLENLKELLQPFAVYTTLTSGDDVTISSVIPILMELKIHLKEVSLIELYNTCALLIFLHVDGKGARFDSHSSYFATGTDKTFWSFSRYRSSSV